MYFPYLWLIYLIKPRLFSHPGNEESVKSDGSGREEEEMEGEEETTPPPNDSQFPSTQDLFGTQSSPEWVISAASPASPTLTKTEG